MRGGKILNKNWSYVPFSQIFSWCKKSTIGSNDGKPSGKYKLFIASATKIKYFDEYLEEGESLIFGTGGNPCIYYVDEKFAYTNHTETAKKKIDNVNLKFYYYYFQKNRFEQLATTFVGGGIKNSSKKKIGALSVPLPTVEEQNKIVAKIEELFSELDKAVDTLQNIKKQLAVYRQAVLKEAFFLCDTIKTNVVCEHITDGDHMPPPKSQSGIPFIMISNIIKNNICWDNTNYVTQDYYNSIGNKRIPKKGDVLYTVTGSYGIPIKIDFDKQFCFQRHIALLRPNSKIDQDFLYYALQTPDVYFQARKRATGTAQKTVGLSVLRDISIPFCSSIEQQKKIVSCLESRLSVCDNIEKTIDTALLKSETLRQTILKQAFEGELIK